MPQEYRMAELEPRLGDLEKCIDYLQQEVGHPKRTVRHQWKTPDDVELPPVATHR